jgi:hypothetical protein
LKIADTKILIGYSEIEKTTKRNIPVQIHFNSSLKKVHLKKSDINISIINIEKLALDMDQSTVWFNEDMSRKKKTSIQSLDIVAKNHSVVSTNSIKVDSLGLLLQNSKANIQSSDKMSDSSRSDINQQKDISAKRDVGFKIDIGRN